MAEFLFHSMDSNQLSHSGVSAGLFLRIMIKTGLVNRADRDLKQGFGYKRRFGRLCKARARGIN